MWFKWFGSHLEPFREDHGLPCSDREQSQTLLLMALQRSLSIVSAAACIGTAGAFLLPWSVASIHKVTTLSSSVGSRRILIRGGAEGVNSATAAADVRMTAAQVGPDDLYIVGSGYLG